MLVIYELLVHYYVYSWEGSSNDADLHNWQQPGRPQWDDNVLLIAGCLYCCMLFERRLDFL